MANEERGWKSLIKTEDWLAVWIGFIVIFLILGVYAIKAPKFKWVTDGEFAGFLAEAGPTADKMAKAAGEKGETALQSQAAALKAAIDKGDRKAVGDAGKKLQEVAKEVKDKTLKKAAGELGKEAGANAGDRVGKVFTVDNILLSVYAAVAILILSIIAMALMGAQVGRFIIGFPIVFIIAWVSLALAGNYSIRYYGLEYVLWCLFLGLLISNVIGVPDWLKEAVRTEFYIKTGLVILGSSILFKKILEGGGLGMLQGILVVSVIWYLCYWIARKLDVDEEFAAILSSAVSICGVSAAIATSGAIKGDPKKLSYTTSIVLVCAVPMMVLMPIISKAFGIPDAVAGAWLGGTLDTSGSVVAAGSLISEAAMNVGVIVKMAQNVLIGVAAFILAVVWTFKKAEEVPGGEKPGLLEIWHRFPKFVLGFMAASVLFSFFLSKEAIDMSKGSLDSIRTFWFALAFVSIGLETKFSELATLGGGRPAIAFLIAQGINVIWTLILAYIFFGGVLFAAPKF
jgi:uncharacterized integral membrane protein (TIGR00698 family)